MILIKIFMMKTQSTMLPNQNIPLRAVYFARTSCHPTRGMNRRGKKLTENDVQHMMNDQSLISFLLDSQC